MDREIPETGGPAALISYVARFSVAGRATQLAVTATSAPRSRFITGQRYSAFRRSFSTRSGGSSVNRVMVISTEVMQCLPLFSSYLR